MVIGEPRRPGPRTAVVLLGASNLTRAISTVVETAQLARREPLDIHAALGHGRSYGSESSVLTRSLTGIVRCGLWNAVERQTEGPRLALITDIGNDLLYQIPIPTIATWVEQCLQRLSASGAQTVLTSLPVCNLRSLTPARYRFFKRMFFPNCKFDFSTVITRAEQLNEEVQRLGTQYGATFVEPLEDWYGRDPIHIKLRHWPMAWSHILSSWNTDGQRPVTARGSLRRWIYLRTRVPEQRTVLGFRQAQAQPSGFLRDGTTVSLY